MQADYFSLAASAYEAPSAKQLSSNAALATLGFFVCLLASS